MRTVMVIFGGVSTEHDVSVVTAAQAMAVMDGYRVVPVYIGRDGVWRSDRRMTTIESIKKVKGKKVHLRPSSPYLYCGSRRIARIDAVLSCNHGLGGEDGSAAVWARTSGLPVTCGGIAACAVGMDKILTKDFLRGIGLPIVPGVAVRAGGDAVRAASGIPFPVVVKPARLGSSIGIAMAHDEHELKSAAEVAFSYDERILIEEGITDRRELNCAAIGAAERVTVGQIEEAGGIDEVLSFADKYLRGGKSGGMDSAARRVPARISEELQKEIVSATKKIFAALDMRGVVRVDFIYDNAGKRLYVNEINGIPGSLAYYLFPKLGMRGVIDRILADAAESCRSDSERITDFKTELEHGK